MANADSIAVEFELGEQGEALRFAWSPSADLAVESRSSPWRVESEVDWHQVEAVRLLAARFETGRQLAVAAVRPRGAAGHGGDSIASYLTIDGEPVPVAEALLSTEYDPEGLARRVGVELIVDPDAAPLRLAGDREGPVEIAGDGLRREAARMAFRVGGISGSGIYEILRQA